MSKKNYLKRLIPVNNNSTLLTTRETVQCAISNNILNESVNQSKDDFHIYHNRSVSLNTHSRSESSRPFHLISNPKENLNELSSINSSHSFDYFLSNDFYRLDFDKIEEDQLVIIPSQQNHPKLCHNGFFYTIDKSYDNIINWKCERTGSKAIPKCSGRAQTKNLNKMPVYVTVEHNHEPDLIQTEVYLTVSKILQQAKNSNETARSIIKNYIDRISPEATKRMPRNNALVQRIIRIRQHKNDHEPNIIDLENNDVPLSLQNTIKDENFLHYDSGYDGSKRILVFATQRNFNYLNKIKDWYLDFILSISSDLSYQMFALQAKINGKSLPFVYAVISDKTQITYIKLLQTLKVYLKNPQSISCGFEKEVFNAIQECFPSCEIYGCWFQFCQYLWSHMQKQNLVSLYNFANAENKNIWKSYQWLRVLPFVPIEDITYGFQFIKKNSSNDFLPMLVYFEKYYIGDLQNDNIRMTQVFPIQFWNMYNRVLKDLAKTNNSTDYWYKTLVS